MFSWHEQYFTRSLRSLVRYCSCHSNIKFISSHHRVISSICETSMLLFVSVCCYAKPRCYYSCLYAVMRNLDAIIRVRVLLCETSMLLFVFVCCYAKPRCYCSCPYAVMPNLDAIILVRMLLCETSMLLFVFRIMFVFRVFRELDRYGLARVIN